MVKVKCLKKSVQQELIHGGINAELLNMQRFNKIKEINFWFKSGDVAGADCYDRSDKMSYADHLRVGMLSNGFNTWLKNEQQ